MNRQVRVWQLVADCLRNEVPVMLLYVLESSGSSPGRQGFGMAVSVDGRMEGSIGGGIMEHKLVTMAREALKKEAGTEEGKIRKQVHDAAALKNRSGMICSGEQTVWLYRVQAASLEQTAQILAALSAHQGGTLQLSPAGPQFSQQLPSLDFYFELRGETDWLYQERIGYKNTLHVIGGGHCALALCRLMSGLDFYIHLYDDRAALHTMEQNGYAHEKHKVEDYSELSELIPPSDNHYVVIMTFGYRTDAIALRALLDRPFRYLGVLGSQKKIGQLFESLQNEGFPGTALTRVHAPIGLSINSRTPEEIAVSIAAQIIRIKNGA